MAARRRTVVGSSLPPAGPHTRGMKRTHPALWGAGWAGLFVGALMTVGGLVSTSELWQMAGGYGLLMAGSAVYLLGGLGLRQTLARRARLAQVTRIPPRTATIGSRIPASPTSR